MRAEVALNDIFKGKPPSPDALAENFEREVVKLKLKVCRPVGLLESAVTFRRSRNAWRPLARRGSLPRSFERVRRLVSSLASCPWSFPHYSLVWPHSKSSVHGSLVGDLIPTPPDMFTFHIPFSRSTSYLIVTIPTRSCSGTTSYSTYATMSAFSTLSSSGSSRSLLFFSSHAILSVTGPSQARL
jgi:hypothetical protein